MSDFPKPPLVIGVDPASQGGDTAAVVVRMSTVDFPETENGKRWGIALRGIARVLEANGYGNLTAPDCLKIILELARVGLGE